MNRVIFFQGMTKASKRFIIHKCLLQQHTNSNNFGLISLSLCAYILKVLVLLCLTYFCLNLVRFLVTSQISASTYFFPLLWQVAYIYMHSRWCEIALANCSPVRLMYHSQSAMHILSNSAMGIFKYIVIFLGRKLIEIWPKQFLYSLHSPVLTLQASFVGLSQALTPNPKMVSESILDPLLGHLHCHALVQARSLGLEWVCWKVR